MSGFYELISSSGEEKELAAAWIISGPDTGAKALFAKEGERLNLSYLDKTFPPDLAEKIAADENFDNGTVTLEGRRIFLEQISEKKRLVICGAGHVSMPLIRIGRLLGYEVTVIDDRMEFAERAGEAGAHHTVCRPFAEALEEITGGSAAAFVVVTRGHSHDVECLRRILKKQYAYAGMMGSHTRTGLIRTQLIREGFPENLVNGIHMPIGLPIGARTPEEIAVSVFAQLIQTMNLKLSGEGFPEGMAEEICTLQKDPDQKSMACVLAIIVEKQEEAPRRPGTKMLIRGDGSFLGTVGGGYAEARILDHAREMIRSGCTSCTLERVTMHKGSMQCGGEIEVFLMPLSASARQI